MSESDILLQRRRARAEKSRNDAALADLHRQALHAMEQQGQEESIRQTALRRVDMWERDRLCNARYVVEWRRILALPVAAMPAAVWRDDDEGVALRQNSPFGFLVHGDAA